MKIMLKMLINQVENINSMKDVNETTANTSDC